MSDTLDEKIKTFENLAREMNKKAERLKELREALGTDATSQIDVSVQKAGDICANIAGLGTLAAYAMVFTLDKVSSRVTRRKFITSAAFHTFWASLLSGVTYAVSHEVGSAMYRLRQEQVLIKQFPERTGQIEEYMRLRFSNPNLIYR